LLVLSLNIPNREIKRLVQQEVLNLLKENLKEISSLINREELVKVLSKMGVILIDEKKRKGRDYAGKLP
jgi:hypothetical protein